jgi:hypothetical protein
MKKLLTGIILGTICLCGGGQSFAENLIENGSFDNPSDPLTGWVTDYRWAKNNQYMDNYKNVSVVSMHKGNSTVCRIFSDKDAGTKVESMAIPFEEGYRYRATFKYNGPDYRVYFAGYRWKPGVKPHDNPPKMEELRACYKSRAESGKASGGWKTVTLELPGKKMSEGMKPFLKQIKFITLYVYILRTGYLDEVVITKSRDPSMKFN